MNDGYNTGRYEDMDGILLDEITRSSSIVIFVSSLTDTRMLVKQLLSRNIPFKVVEMGMGSVSSRSAFRGLCKMTQWHLLPQIFLNDKFVGGADELYKHLNVAPNFDLNKNPVMPGEETLQ